MQKQKNEQISVRPAFGCIFVNTDCLGKAKEIIMDALNEHPDINVDWIDLELIPEE